VAAEDDVLFDQTNDGDDFEVLDGRVAGWKRSNFLD